MDGESKYVHLHNVHYCPELESNLLSLEVLEKKSFKFIGKQEVLSVIDNQGDTVLQAKHKGTVYPLLQPCIQQTKPLTNPILKITKPVIQKKWHPRKVYSDCRNLAGLPKVTKKPEPGVNITEQFPPVGVSTQSGLPKDQDYIIGKPKIQNSWIQVVTQIRQISWTSMPGKRKQKQDKKDALMEHQRQHYSQWERDSHQARGKPCTSETEQAYRDSIQLHTRPHQAKGI